MPNFSSAKYMFAMVPTNRAVHNNKKFKENLYIYTLKQDLSLPGSLILWGKHWNAHKASRSFQSTVIVYQNVY